MAKGVQVKGVEECLRKMDGVAKAYSVDRIEGVLLRGAQMFRNEAYINAPIGETGGLRRSIIAKMLKRMRTFSAAIFAIDFRKITGRGKRSRYPYIVEYGADPHVIKPKPPKKALSLLGGRFFAESVNHPGFRGRRFFRDSVSSKRRAVVKLIETELKNLMPR